MSQWTQLGFIFVTASAACFMLLLIWQRRRARVITQEDADGDDPPAPDQWSQALSVQIPMSSETRAELQTDLRGAGYYETSALTEYTALRAVLVIAPLVIAGACAILLDASRTRNIVLGGLALSALGYSLPRLYLVLRARARGRQIQRGLPLAIDLLTLCLSAGQNLLASLRQVSEELGRSYPVLGRELAIASRQAELHSLEQAMKQLADRIRLPEVSNVALLLIQSEKLGTDATTTLIELANNYRTTSRQRAEAQANRTSFWLLFPSVFCFLVPSAIILIGPAYLELVQDRERAAQTFSKSRDTVLRANDNSGRLRQAHQKSLAE